MNKVLTTIYLDREFENIKPSLVYELTAPNGFKIVHILALTKDMKRLFEEANIAITEKIVERDVNSNDIQIGDICVSRIAPDELLITSDNEDEARRKYNSLKARLPNYNFLGHDCETKSGEPCKRFKSQSKLPQ